MFFHYPTHHLEESHGTNSWQPRSSWEMELELLHLADFDPFLGNSGLVIFSMTLTVGWWLWLAAGW